MNDLPPSTVLAEGKYLRLVARGHWEYAERTTATGAVTIVAITDSRRLVPSSNSAFR
jgi:ADP-ribose pyrophosphatase